LGSSNPATGTAANPELVRRADPAWRTWGPYVAARQWGTVREDYSADGDAWSSFGFDQSHARAYRWGEDGLAAICDRWQFLCFGLALWNGADPILKERAFGLTNSQGNHGEDAKEYWWVLDDTPTHSWSRWLYRYPQAAYPYDELRRVNAGRGKDEREYELSDTSALADNRFFDVTVSYAKAGPDDIHIVIEATNHGPDAAPLHLLPTIWFRNTWAWGRDDRHPSLQAQPDGRIRCDHQTLGTYWLAAEGGPATLVTQNETNAEALFDGTNRTPYTKDGIGRHVIDGADTVDPSGQGTKAAFWYRWDTVRPGETVRARLRLSTKDDAFSAAAADQAIAVRAAEADTFYDSVLADTPEAERQVARRCFAGLLWSTKLYRFGVQSWLDGDPAGPKPPPERDNGRNSRWTHLDLAELMSLPDEWEYPWFAAWDLAFHTVPLSYVDPQLAKDQLILLSREWLMHPDGQLPAYEWNFGDVNPPVHAWAALRVFRIDAAASGVPDLDFLKRVFHKQLLTFSWWVNRKDADGSNIFEGGFLGMDNVGPFDRSTPPPGWRLEQSDATSWMGVFCLSMLEIAFELARADHSYEDAATKFFEHFLSIAEAASRFGGGGIWDEQDGFCYDVLSRDGASPEPLRVRSMSGLLPIAAATTIPAWVWGELPGFASRVAWLAKRHPDRMRHLYRGTGDVQLLSLLDPGQLGRVLHRMLDEDEFLSPYGIRSLSAAYRDGLTFQVDGETMSIDYEPAESRSGLFGGNSNWRGPIWFPVNVLLTDALRAHHSYTGADLQVALPTGGAATWELAAVADELDRRLVALFLPGESGRRPGTPRDHGDGPGWSEHPTYSEYFDGDTGIGLGASHQTGWTALVGALIAQRSRKKP
jgi:hypothetical protein